MFAGFGYTERGILDKSYLALFHEEGGEDNAARQRIQSRKEESTVIPLELVLGFRHDALAMTVLIASSFLYLSVTGAVWISNCVPGGTQICAGPHWSGSR